MKTKVLFLAAIMTLVACNSNEPNYRSHYEQNLPFDNVLYNGKSPYLDWFLSNMESFASYASQINPSNEAMKYEESATRAEDDLLTLKNDIKIRVHDEPKWNTEGDQATLLLTRTVSRDIDPANEITHAYSYEMSAAKPFQLIRPQVDNDNPMPLCYYSDFLLEWNEDTKNKNGVMVVAEWTGSLLGESSQNKRVVNVDIVEDKGRAVLNEKLFDSIPDGALVSLWLVRGNMMTINGAGEITLDEALNRSPEEFVQLLKTNPELCTQLRPYTLGAGAVYRLSMVLIRNLE